MRLVVRVRVLFVDREAALFQSLDIRMIRGSRRLSAFDMVLISFLVKGINIRSSAVHGKKIIHQLCQ